MTSSNSAHINKIDAANRQFDTAIELLFSNADPVSVHSLICAASTIISDLVKHKKPEDSWDHLVQKANNLDTNEYLKIMRKSQNFFKHADKDPDGVLDFDPSESDHIGFIATLNLGELGHELNLRQSLFQMWYLAWRYDKLGYQTDISQIAIDIFGNLRNSSRDERIKIGAEIIRQHLNE